MAKVFRCPACGSLWRVNDDFESSLLRCSECQAVYPANKAEFVLIDDKALDERLASESPKAAAAAPAGAEQTMKELAKAMDDFDSRPAPEAEKSAPAKTSHTALWSVVFIVLLTLIAGALALIGHETVLTQYPTLRPAYEQVCHKAPCPGFVWSDTSAIAVKARLTTPAVIEESMPAEPEQTVDMSAEPVPPVAEPKVQPPKVDLVLTNTSRVPQYAPTLDVQLLDPAGEALAGRVLEPADYGFNAKTVIAPGEQIRTTITIKTPMPYPPHSVSATPIAMQ